nr:MAP7 domain-containing protein 1-like [Aegilops tauschii subsp. strangulata]
MPMKPAGIALLKRTRDYVAVDQPTPPAKRKKEEPRTTEAKQLPAAVPPPAQKDEAGSRALPAGLSSRGSEAQPQEKAITVAKPAPEAPALSSPAEVPKAPESPALSAATASPVLTLAPSPPPSNMPSGHDSSAVPGVLEEALVAWSQAVVASEEGRQVAGLATADPDAAVKDAKAAEERCHTTEAKLKNLRDKQAAQARQLEVQEEELKAREAAVADRDTKLEQAAREQATERGRLEKLKEEVEAEKAQLEARKKLLAEAEEAAATRRATFDSLEMRSRKAL